MIRLRVLGSQQLERESGEAIDAVVAQPKRFALLSYLALAAGTLVRRDTLLAIFWPELNQFAARRALRNTVYQLRRELGGDVFRTRGDEEIGIDAEVLSCDVAAFRDALERGDLEGAATLYRGEFLRDFQLAGDQEEFETWLRSERERLAEQVLGALDSLVTREQQAGRFANAARWSIRAQGIAPSDPRWAQRTKALLATSHNGGPPSAKEPGRPAPAAESTIATQQPSRDVRPRSTHPLQYAITAIALIALTVAAFVMMAARRARTRPDPHRLVVTVFQNRTGDPRLDALGDMAADWISRGLFAAGLGEVVDPGVLAVRGRGAGGRPVDPLQLARLTGAGTIVQGYYYRSNDSVLFAVSLADASTGRITGQVEPVGGPIARPASALDDVRSRVMTALSVALDSRFGDGAQMVQPPPYPAYSVFLQAADSFWAGDYPQAERLDRQALQIDPAFGRAAVALATTAANARHCALTDSLAKTWPTDRGGLTEADRLTLAIAVANCRGEVDEMFRLTTVRAHVIPHSSWGLLSSANAALWANRPGATLAILREVNPDIDLAWLLDSAHHAFFESIGEADHQLRRYADERRTADRLRPLGPLGATWLDGRALAAMGRGRDAVAAADSAMTMAAEPAVYWGLLPGTEGRPQYSATGGWVAAWISRELFAHGDSSDGRLVASRTLAWAQRRDSSERSTLEVRLLIATARDLLGDYSEERTVLQALVHDDSSSVDLRGLLAGAEAGAGDTASANAGDRWLSQLDPSRAGWGAPLYRARIAAREHRLDDAVAFVRASRSSGAWLFWVHCDPAVFAIQSRPDYQALMAPKG